MRFGPGLHYQGRVMLCYVVLGSQQQHFHAKPLMLESTREEEVQRAFLFLTRFVCAVPMFSWCLANI